MTTQLEDIDALATAIVKHLAEKPAIPIESALWTTADIAAYLKVSARQVSDRYAPLPDFPRAIRLPCTDGHRSHPRWKAAEIVEWAERHQERKRAA